MELYFERLRLNFCFTSLESEESNIDFLPKLISEKKFINVVKNLTIFVEEYKKDGKLNKIYINEKSELETWLSDLKKTKVKMKQK